MADDKQVQLLSQIKDNLAAQNKDADGRKAEPLTEKGVENAVAEGTKKAFGSDFVEKFNKSIASVAKSVKDGIASLGSKLGGKAKSLWDKILDELVDAALAIGAIIASFAFFKGFENATKWFGDNADFGDKLASVLVTFFGSLLGLSDEQQKKVATFLSDWFHKIWEFIGNIFEGLKNIVSGIIDGDGGQILEGIKMIFDSLLKNLTDAGTAILNWIVGEDTANKITTFLGQIFSGVMGIFTAMYDYVMTIVDFFKGDASLEDVWNAFTNIGSSIIDYFTAVVDAWMELLDLKPLIENAKTFVVGMWESAMSALIDFVNGIIKYIPGVDYIKNPYTGEDRQADEDKKKELNNSNNYVEDADPEAALMRGANDKPQEKAAPVKDPKRAKFDELNAQLQTIEQAVNDPRTSPEVVEKLNGEKARIQGEMVKLYQGSGSTPPAPQQSGEAAKPTQSKLSSKIDQEKRMFAKSRRGTPMDKAAEGSSENAAARDNAQGGSSNTVVAPTSNNNSTTNNNTVVANKFKADPGASRKYRNDANYAF